MSDKMNPFWTHMIAATKQSMHPWTPSLHYLYKYKPLLCLCNKLIAQAGHIAFVGKHLYSWTRLEASLTHIYVFIYGLRVCRHRDSHNFITYPDSKIHGANMGPIWVDRTQVGPMLVPWTLPYGYTSAGMMYCSRFTMVVQSFFFHVTLLILGFIKCDIQSLYCTTDKGFVRKYLTISMFLNF